MPGPILAAPYRRILDLVPHRMGLLRLLVLCTLAACCVARSIPGPPPPQRPFSPLNPLGCNDSEVLAVADFALQNINRDQKDGYMLSLNRVHDVREHYQEDMGSLFYLTLDVLETGCHVLSKKAQKDCKPRIFYESIYGQCKAMFHVNKPRRVLYLLAYNCTLRPVSRAQIRCPDCPFRLDVSNPSVLEAATESLAKFNSKSPSKQYALVKVTKAKGQWVVGPSYYVEYLIKESPCTQSQASCSLQPSDSEPVGLCHGSLSEGSRIQLPLIETFDSEKSVTVTCEFFESQAQVPGGENPAVTQGPNKVPQKNTAAPTSSPSITTPRGSIQHLPDLDAEKPEDSKGESPEEPFPVQLDLTTNPQGDTLDVSFLYLEPEEKKLVVLPFPGKGQRSAECPGPAEEKNSLIFLL